MAMRKGEFDMKWELLVLIHVFFFRFWESLKEFGLESKANLKVSVSVSTSQ